jgi:hypothetical protein
MVRLRMSGDTCSHFSHSTCPQGVDGDNFNFTSRLN